MENFVIDINCDVGEGIGNERALLPLISSCNIACGGHYGDQHTMKEVVLLAKKYKVKVGAHPSYPDPGNFGRVSMSLAADDLTSTIQDQLSSFLAILKTEQVPLRHIKAHGALYNDTAKDLIAARSYLKAISSLKKSAFLYVPFGSVIEREAVRQGFQIKREAFADRNYNIDLSLVSRKLPHAVLDNSKKVLTHLVSMVKKKQVQTFDGAILPIKADTFCIHGDTPAALQILMYLSKQLVNHNIEIARE